MEDFVRMMSNYLLDMLFPEGRCCIVCRQKLPDGQHVLCLNCTSRIKPILPPICTICGRPIDKSGRLCSDCMNQKHSFVQARSFGEYDGVLKKVIHEFKYHGRKELAGFIGDKMFSVFEGLGWPEFDVIVPVPLHKKRQKERGFNQAYLLASYLREKIGIPICNDIIRIKHTEHQTLLSRHHRKKNLKGAFRLINNGLIKDKTVLLVDDVYTTGSTAEECSVTMKEAGAKHIYVLTCARG
jgi:competence protein ComFC